MMYDLLLQTFYCLEDEIFLILSVFTLTYKEPLSFSDNLLQHSAMTEPCLGLRNHNTFTISVVNAS